jgi:hypothetical protein
VTATGVRTSDQARLIIPCSRRRVGPWCRPRESPCRARSSRRVERESLSREARGDGVGLRVQSCSAGSRASSNRLRDTDAGRGADVTSRPGDVRRPAGRDGWCCSLTRSLTGRSRRALAQLLPYLFQTLHHAQHGSTNIAASWPFTRRVGSGPRPTRGGEGICEDRSKRCLRLCRRHVGQTVTLSGTATGLKAGQEVWTFNQPSSDSSNYYPNSGPCPVDDRGIWKCTNIGIGAAAASIGKGGYTIWAAVINDEDAFRAVNAARCISSLPAGHTATPKCPETFSVVPGADIAKPMSVTVIRNR